MMFLLVASALAESPDRHVATLVPDGASLEGLVLLEELELAGTLNAGGNTVEVLDLQTWEFTSASVCGDVVAVGIAGRDVGESAVFYVACYDGTVDTVLVDEDREVSAGAAFTVYDDEDEVDMEGLALGNGDSGEDRLWVILTADSTLQSWYVDDLDADTPTVTQGGSFAQSGFEFLRASPNYVHIAHGNQRISRIQSTTGSISVTTENQSGDYTDLDFWGDSTDVGLLSDSGGSVVRYQPTSENDEFQRLVSDLDSPDALALNQDALDPWVVVADGLDLVFYEFTTASNAVASEPFLVLPMDDHLSAADPLEEIEVASSHILGLAEDDDLHVFSWVPWVEIDTDLSDIVHASGDSVTLDFTSDVAGSYELVADDREGSEVFASGEILAGESLSASFTVPDTFVEGPNRVYVTVREDGLLGWDAVDVVVDTPPPAPVVELGFGDGFITVTLSTEDDVADLVSYEVYLSETAFEAADYPTDGPGDPTTVDADDAYLKIEGLDNGATYWVGVRCVDEADTRGEMSTVKSIVPQPTVGAAGLAGETGGLGCSTLGGGGLLAALAGLGLTLGRRRRRGGLAVLSVLGLALPLSAQAQDSGAQDEGETPEVTPHPGWTAKTSSIGVVAGSFEMNAGNADSVDAWEQVYGGKMTGLRLTGSKQLVRFFAVDGSVGVLRKEGSEYAEDGTTSSGNPTKMTVLPLSAGVTLRLDPFLPHDADGFSMAGREFWGMPLVPYASFGLDYLFFTERNGALDAEDLFANTRVSGGHAGWHYALGAEILLDWLGPRRASVSKARWGIEDTYVQVEWRRTTQFSDAAGEDLNFGGDVITLGLKVDLE